MSWSVRELKGDEVRARDGRVGTLDDVYFDDERWQVRYMVVDTQGWVAGRRMLVSPEAIETDLSDPGKLRVAATCDELKAAPGAETAPPVAEQQRIAAAKALGPPYYWSSATLWGAAAMPGSAPAAAGAVSPSPTEEDAEIAARRMVGEGDPHLRSSAEVIGYGVQAPDGSAAGKVQDFLIDERDWTVRGVVVDTKPWWPGGETTVRTEDVERIDWGARTVFLRVSRDALKR